MKAAALAQLVRTCEKPVRTMLQRSGVTGAAIDDLAQDVWLRLLRLGNEDLIDNPIAFVCQTARNALYEQKSRCRERKPHEPIDELSELLLDETAIDDELVDAQMRMAVRGAVGQLPPRQRECLQMHLDGLTYKQIAAAKGMTYRLVLRDLVRAYGTLRNHPVLLEFRS